jgi:transcriptional regulator with XRE-family HTH domain
VGDGDERRLSAYDELPACEITASQLVAWNMARFRQAAGMKQEELARHIGSTRKSVSALETSWKGGRPRQFDATEIVALAHALRVPVTAFLLPPEDDGVTCRYVLLTPDGQDDLSMAELASYLESVPSDDDSPAMDYYRHRHLALGAYRDPARLHEIAGTFDDYTTEEHISSRMTDLDDHYAALRKMLLDIDGQQDGLQRKLERIRRQ